MIELNNGIRMKTLTLGDVLSVDYLEIAPGTVTPPMVHYECEEALYLLEGSLRISVGGKQWLATAGDCIEIPKGVVHGSINSSGFVVKMLAVCTPSFCIEFQHEVN